MVVMCRSREQAEAALQRLRDLLADLGLQAEGSENAHRVFGGRWGGGGLPRLPPPDGALPVPRRATTGHFPRSLALRIGDAACPRQDPCILTAKRRLFLPVEAVVQDVNMFLRGWVGYFQYGHSAKRLSKIRYYVRMRIALFISKRHRRSRTLRGVGATPPHPNEYGLISLYGIVVSPRAGKPWRERPNAGGERTSVSRVRENRMHGLTGGSWKRSTRPTRAREKNYPEGNPRVIRLRRLQPAAATAPAPDPPT